MIDCNDYLLVVCAIIGINYPDSPNVNHMRSRLTARPNVINIGLIWVIYPYIIAHVPLIFLSNIS